VSDVQCTYCARRCRLSEGGGGYCGMYAAANGPGGPSIVERYPRRYSSLNVNHIESVPFFHFQPGSRTMVLGGAGCNLDCRYCSNAHLARSEPEPLLVYELAPERVVRLTQQHGCHNIAFAINEPSVAVPTLMDVVDCAAAAGLPVGVLTNGYLPAETARLFGQAFAFVNVSIKGWHDAFYARNTGVPSVKPVLRTLEILAEMTHVEVSTPIVQGLNDDDIPAIAGFIRDLNPLIPWHVFRLLPEYKMADAARPNVDVVNAALDGAREILAFVYFGNFVGSQWVSTRCPQCGSTAVKRINLSGCASKAVAYALTVDHRCAACGADLNISGKAVTWHSEDEGTWAMQPARSA